MKKLWSCAAVAAVALATEAIAQDAEQLMQRARTAATLQKHDLNGEIRKDRIKSAIALYLRGKNIQFSYYKGKVPVRFHLRLDDNKFNLFDIKSDGSTVAFPASKLRESILGTDLSYEDLSMRFLYWPKPKLEGAERVGVHDCWKIRINNPGKSGDYALMYVWVHQKFGAFMKIEGFDRSGKRIKRFEVKDVMKIDNDTYTLSKMRVSSMNGDKTTGHTYLDFDEPKKPNFGGPR